MKRKSRRGQSAWGVQIAVTGVRLLRLVKEGDIVRVSDVRVIPYRERWQQGPNWPDVLAELRPALGNDPIGISIADEWVLYRSLTLPQASPELLEQMVAAQVQVVLPASADLLAWGWMGQGAAPADATQRNLLVGAVRRAMLDQITASLGGDRALRAVVPTAMAQAAACINLNPPAGAVVMVDLAAGHTAVTLLNSQGILSARLLEEGSDQWIESYATEINEPLPVAEQAMWRALAEGESAALEPITQRWAQRLGQLVRQGVEELPAGERPRRVIVTGQVGRLAVVRGWIAHATGLPASAVSVPSSLSLPENVAGDESLAAVGAALHAMEAGGGVLNFVKPATRRRSTRRTPLVVAACLLWLFAMAGWMYQMDRREADAWEDALTLARLTAAAQQEDPVNAAVERYLAAGAMPPLTVLAALTELAPQSVLLSGWNYQRDGEVRIAGKVGGAADYEKLINAIGDSPLFEAVSPGEATVENNEWKFTINIRVIPIARFSPPKPEEPQAAVADKPDGAGRETVIAAREGEER